MPGLNELRSELLKDHKITADEVELIQQHIVEDEKYDMEDVKFLIDLLCSATEVCPEFDDLFFPVLKEVVLADGRIAPDEEYYLLKMLYSDGRVRENEKEFLRELQREAKDVPAEFDELCKTAFDAPETDWDVGGRPTSNS